MIQIEPKEYDSSSKIQQKITKTTNSITLFLNNPLPQKMRIEGQNG